MNSALKYLSIAAGALVLAGAAVAQTSTPPGASGPAVPEQRRIPVPAQPRPESPRSESNESLGQAPHSGVIQPPATGDNGVIEPRNRANTPTPEIRPPGTPGGNPNVQPK
ncbi:MAG: hypothetical protein JO128_22605 [Alphaproteobacteria bacterium]|nr:hypothetical protein [Alphaproteobacteria bacterium]